MCQSLLSRVLPVMMVAFGLGGGTPREPVDLMLILAADVSGSMKDPEYDLEKKGTAHALRSPKVLEAIRTCTTNGVALAYAEWGGDTRSTNLFAVKIPFTLVRDQTSLRAFASTMLAQKKASTGDATDIAGALNGVLKMMNTSTFTADRRLADLSGDGEDNVDQKQTGVLGDQTRVLIARDRLAEAGIGINGLTLEIFGRYTLTSAEPHPLSKYYEEYVTTGPSRFVVEAKTYEDFADALERKLSREICTGATN